MKKTFLLISLCMSLLLSACGGEKNISQGEVPVINVETAIQNQQELLLTDLGEKNHLYSIGNHRRILD